MPRSKKYNRVNEHECFVCSKTFEAVRDDARYCSVKCRQQISRAMRAIASTKRALNSSGPQVRCAKCGIDRAAEMPSCPVCKSKKKTVAK